MIPQGFPLWAVEHPSAETPEPDRTVYVVVGWDDNYRTPYLVALGVDWRHTWTPSDGQVFTFTTTDPTTSAPGPVAGSVYGYSMSELAAKLGSAETLRERMSRLADQLDGIGYGGHQEAARLIREELAG